MNVEFEWTESGLALLGTINQIIANNGGSEPYYLKVYDEVYNQDEFKATKNRQYEVFRLKVKYGMSRKDVMSILNLTISEYSRFNSEMNKQLTQ